MCDSRPDIVSCRNRIVDDGTEPSSDNVSVLDRIVQHLLWCATAWLYIRVVAINIKASRVSSVRIRTVAWTTKSAATMPKMSAVAAK